MIIILQIPLPDSDLKRLADVSIYIYFSNLKFYKYAKHVKVSFSIHISKKQLYSFKLNDSFRAY